MVSGRWAVQRNRSPAMELQSARLNQRARRLSGPVGESLGLGVDSQARPYARHRIRNFSRVARVIKANGERPPPKACARSRELLLGRRAKLAWSLLGDLRSPSLDSRKGIGIAIGAQDRNRPIPDSRRWAGRCHLSQMRSDGSSTARYRAWMSRRRLTLCDRDRLTADIDRGRRSRVWPAIAVVSLGLVGSAVVAPGGLGRGVQNYAGNVFGPVAARLGRPPHFILQHP